MIVLPLHGVPNWTRGTVLPTPDRVEPRQGECVRVSLDAYGVDQLEFLSSWPKSSPSSPHEGGWYIVESFDKLSRVQFQSRVSSVPHVT